MKTFISFEVKLFLLCRSPSSFLTSVRYGQKLLAYADDVDAFSSLIILEQEEKEEGKK